MTYHIGCSHEVIAAELTHQIVGFRLTHEFRLVPKGVERHTRIVWIVVIRVRFLTDDRAEILSVPTVGVII